MDVLWTIFETLSDSERKTGLGPAVLRIIRTVTPLTSLGLAMIVLTSGCVQMHPTQSGFLSDYSKLQRMSACDVSLIRPADFEGLATIDSFDIEPVVWLADKLGQLTHTTADAERIRRKMEICLATELGRIRPIVHEIGPRTARVRTAITGVQESKPIVNLVLLPLSGPLFNGGADAEIEIIAANGDQIAAESAALKGREWDVAGLFVRRLHPESAVHRAAKTVARQLTTPLSE